MFRQEDRWRFVLFFVVGMVVIVILYFALPRLVNSWFGKSWAKPHIVLPTTAVGNTWLGEQSPPLGFSCSPQPVTQQSGSLVWYCFWNNNGDITEVRIQKLPDDTDVSAVMVITSAGFWSFYRYDDSYFFEREHDANAPEVPAKYRLAVARLFVCADKFWKASPDDPKRSAYFKGIFLEGTGKARVLPKAMLNPQKGSLPKIRQALPQLVPIKEQADFILKIG